MTENQHLRILVAQFKKYILEGRVKTTHSLSSDYRSSVNSGHIQLISDLNEAQIRQSFILPLVSSLGWDTEDPFEVYPEERTSGGFIDIRTRTNMGHSLVWEIKRPSVSLDLHTIEGKEAAFQGVGYARTFNEFPFCIVTNFEETKVYHAYSLLERDQISENLIASFTWKDFEDGNADSFLKLFTKEAVASGRCKETLDKQITGNINMRAKVPLHDTILNDLEKWRLEMAKAISDHRNDLSLDEVDHATQLTLNRLLFIRCTEDRGMESQNYTRALLEQETIWKHIVESIFPYFNTCYNSDLFETNDLVDDFSLTVPNDVIRNIIRGMHGREEIYDFSIIPLEILGTVYENYLAKQLKKNEEGTLILETKPEIKKSGGVCYTPPHIVEGIVQESLGELFSSRKTKGFKPKILDPACGSGTFLIKALDYLFDKNRQPVTKKSEVPPQLTLEEKRNILVECIFGVDLDERAVEITKLSLFLKLLDGVEESLLIKHAVLPTIEENIRHGNSLITPEMFVNHSDDLDSVRVAPLDWKEFMDRHGIPKGFDAIIGNPPYVRIQVLRKFYPQETDIYVSNYETTQDGNVDLYIPFIEKCITLLKKGGYLGFICPNRFWANDYGGKLRTQISEKKYLHKVINFRAEQVFTGVTTYTCIAIFKAKKNSKFEYIEAIPGTRPEKITNSLIFNAKGITKNSLDARILTEDPWLLAPTSVRNFIHRMEKMPKCLNDYIDTDGGIFQGLITGKDPVFLLENRGNGEYFSKQIQHNVNLEEVLMVPTLKGSADLKRLGRPVERLSMLFPYQLEHENGSTKLISLEVLT